MRVSDADFRALERRFRETEAVEDEAAWLRARVHAGELDQRRLELAAYLGHEGANRALVADGPPEPSSGHTVHRIAALVSGLKSWDAEVATRAHLVVRRFLLAHTQPSPNDYDAEPDPNLTLDTLSKLEEWLIRRPEEVEREALARGGFAQAIVENASDPKLAAQHAARAAAFAVSVVWDKADLRAALTTELVPWALGYRDPLRERVEQRAGAAGE